MMSMQEKDWPCASSGEAGCNTVDVWCALHRDVTASLIQPACGS